MSGEGLGPSMTEARRVIRVRKSHPCEVCGESIPKSQWAVVWNGGGYYRHYPVCSGQASQAKTDSEILAVCRKAINKGWWNLSNIYTLYDKPVSEVLAAFDRAIARAEEAEE